MTGGTKIGHGNQAPDCVRRVIINPPVIHQNKGNITIVMHLSKSRSMDLFKRSSRCSNLLTVDCPIREQRYGMRRRDWSMSGERVWRTKRLRAMKLWCV